MREENKNVSKMAWKRIFRKKWFYPALYLVVASLLLTGVLWYQNLDNQLPEATDNPQTEVDNDSVTGNEFNSDEEAVPVMEQQETIQMPVKEDNQAEIVTKFYDYDADSEDQEKALVLYNNKYYQSKGIDISSADGETFDVTASLSGTVTEVKEDPLLGNVIKISHQDDISTYYASLGDVLVEAGAKVKQGDTVGTAGRNIFGQASGTHVHFELRQGEQAVNPEEFFNQQIAKLKEAAEQDAAAEEETVTDEAPEAEEGAAVEEEEIVDEEQTEEEAVEETEPSAGTEDPSLEEEEDPAAGDRIEDHSETSNKESSAAMADA